jgi:MFS family permease
MSEDMRVKKTIWQPMLLGTVLGVLASVTAITGLAFLTTGITENAIGVHATLFLLAAALGGPLAGVIAPTLWVIIAAFFGPPDMRALLATPAVFWVNVISLAATFILVGFAYRLIFNNVRMPLRLLAWAGVVIGFYAIVSPSSIIPQYLLLGDPVSGIWPAVKYGYETEAPQAIFDIFVTSLVFIALPAAYARPLWYERKPADGTIGEQKNRLATSKRESQGAKDNGVP